MGALVFPFFLWALQPKLCRSIMGWPVCASFFLGGVVSSPDCIGVGVYWPVCFIFFFGLSSPDCIGFGVYWPVLGLSSPDCIGFGVYWPVCFIFLAVQPRLYRFWCLLACVFHIFFGLSSPDCIGFGVYWPVCFIFLDCPAQIV